MCSLHFWLVAEILKFLINSYKARRLASDLIGYGGLPSNHAAIVSSIALLIAQKEGSIHLRLTFPFLWPMLSFWMQVVYVGRSESMLQQLIS